jgi:HK97 family phage prohead protease
MDPLQHKECVDADFKIFDDGPSGSFSGYASVFGNRDRQGEIVLKGAFADTLPSFLKDGFGALNHEWNSLPLATISEAREDERGLYVEGQFHSTPNAQAARKIMQERRERGKSVGLSIGYKVRDDEQTKDARLLKKLDLYEISFVSVPANAEAQVTAIKGGAGSWDETSDAYHYRVNDPGKYSRIRSKPLEGVPHPVMARYGVPKGGGGMEMQSLVFPKSDWTADEAHAWVAKHGPFKSILDQLEHLEAVRKQVRALKQQILKRRIALRRH